MSETGQTPEEMLARIAELEAENAHLKGRLAVAQAHSASSSPSVGLPMGSGKGILIVDDSKVILSRLKSIIAWLGYEVVGLADSGEFGADMAVTLNPALVLLDHSMPGMNGVACAQAILASRPECRIVVLSGFLTEDQGRQYAAMGITDLLAKPLQTELLSGCLQRYLGPPGR